MNENDNKSDANSWLLEEYKLLSANYFHEDDQLEKSMVFYASINTSMVAFLASTFSSNQFIYIFLISGLGIIICMLWLVVIVRVSSIRNNIIKRIYKIEDFMHTQWQDLQFKPLNSKSFEIQESRRTRNPFRYLYQGMKVTPSHFMDLILPSVFIILWCILIGYKVSNIATQKEKKTTSNFQVINKPLLGFVCPYQLKNIS